MAGAYLLDARGAESILEHARSVRVDTQIDWFHNACVEAGRLDLDWSHPVLTRQAGNSGALPSMLDARENRPLRKYVFLIERAFERRLYSLR